MGWEAERRGRKAPSWARLTRDDAAAAFGSVAVLSSLFFCFAIPVNFDSFTIALFPSGWAAFSHRGTALFRDSSVSSIASSIRRQIG